MPTSTILIGDCLEVLRGLRGNASRQMRRCFSMVERLGKSQWRMEK